MYDRYMSIIIKTKSQGYLEIEFAFLLKQPIYGLYSGII